MDLRRVALGLVGATSVLASTAPAQDDGWRTIEIETTEVTAPDVAITPDGETLIFTLLGHLFRLPVEGGDAEQLTFGPYYDTRPAVSPNGRLVAFQSDRDGSEGNIFLLELATRDITQLTHEPWADAPSWAPDGESVVYLQLVREAWNSWNPWGEGPNQNPHHQPPPAVVRRVRLDGGEPETLRAEVSEIRSPFHLPDGRVGWGVVERDSDSPRVTTRIEVRDRDGMMSTQRSIEGVAQAIVASDEEFFLRRHIPLTIGGRAAQQREIVRVPHDRGQERPVVPVSYARALIEPRFALAGDGAALYVGDLGRLWKVTLARDRREAIPFRARVNMEVRDPTPPPIWNLPEPGATKPPTSIHFPRLSPDGRRLVFMAARELWQQPLDGGPIQHLNTGITADPTFSPDGRYLAFVQIGQRANELRIYDLATGQTRTEVRNRSPNWTPDGERLIVVDDPDNRSFRVVAIDVADGTTDTLAEVEGLIFGSVDATISPDGRWLNFAGRGVPGHPADWTVFRLSLRDRTARPEAVTEFGAMGYLRGRVSPDGQWFAYRPPNRLEIRVVPLGGVRVSAEDSRLFSPVGGNTGFAFTHDGSAIVYAGAGTSVWRHPLNGAEPEEIPVRLELERPAPPPPMLIRRVRMLDFGAGGFGSETSVLIEDGRIQWTGTERELPPGTVTLDAVGRFAIPGLFDMHAHRESACRGGRGRAYLSYGITSVRNMGGEAVELSQAADREFTGYASPRCFYAGYLIEAEQGRNENHYIHPTDEAEVRAQARSMYSLGASFIKLYQVLPWPWHRAAADEARQLGLPVVSHGWFPEQVIRAVTLGGQLTHGPQKAHDDLLQLLLAMGIRTDPDLGGFAGQWVLRRRDPERFPGPQPISPVGDDALAGFYAAALASVKQRYDLGITLLPGTDWGATGWALQLELEFFAESGIPPIDILRFATQASAETVGAGDDLGTLEVGKLADIVLLDANPLEDIKNTQSIWRVIKGGFVFDPEELRPERN